MSLESAIADNTLAIRDLIAALAGRAGAPAPADAAPVEAKQEKPEAKKPSTSESATTPKSSPAKSAPQKDAGKVYGYDEVKALITQLANPASGIEDGRAKAVAILARFGLKVLPKDAAADTLQGMGVLAVQTIAGEVDPRDAVEA